MRQSYKTVALSMVVLTNCCFGTCVLEEDHAQETKLFSYHSSAYNRLPEVEDVNNALTMKGPEYREGVLGSIKSLVLDYKAEDFLGVRLLHKHFTMEPGSAMVEKGDVMDGQNVLVTQPYTWTQASQASPASWMYSSKDGWRVFEFSADPVVDQSTHFLKHHPALMEDFSDLLATHKATGFFGLAVMGRKWELNPKEDELLMENSYLSPICSVIGIEPESLSSLSAIQTGWTFLGDPKSYYCPPLMLCDYTRSGHPKYPAGHWDPK